MTFGPHGLASIEFEEDVADRIAVVRSGAGAVVISTTRNRNLVTGAPVLFWNVRRIDSVPELPEPTRMRFGGKVEARHGATRVSNILLRTLGLSRFSGPAAPRVGVGLSSFTGFI